MAPNLLRSQGKIFMNNSPVLDYNQITGLIGYVTQDDILDAYLSPKETLYYTAKLKLWQLSEQEIEKRVESVIK